MQALVDVGRNGVGGTGWQEVGGGREGGVGRTAVWGYCLAGGPTGEDRSHVGVIG